jgi:hypothetical protein
MFTRRCTFALAFVLSIPVWTSPLVHAQCHNWSTEFATNVNGYVYALQVFDDGSGPVLWAGGDFCSVPYSCQVSRWNGQSWLFTPTTELDDTVKCLAVYDDGTGPSIYAGGLFTEQVRRWNGSGWASVGGGMHGPAFFTTVTALSSYDSGNGAELYVGGSGFTGAGFATGKGILKWNGHMWSALGTGLGPTAGATDAAVGALHVFDDGTGPALYVGGLFGSAGGVAVNGLARWNGTQWSAVGSNGSKVIAFATFNDGNGPALYATGTFQLPAGGTTSLARWDGSTWVDVPHPFSDGSPALVVADDGNGPALISEVIQPGIVARWDGQSWSAFGNGVNGDVWAMSVFDEGHGNGPELFVGGQFSSAGGGTQSRGIAKWTTCSLPIESFCPGDQTLSHCPCDNSGVSGHGCNNSISSGGALLTASGTTSPDTLVLTSSAELPSALSIFLQGNVETQFVLAFGDGLRCIGGQLLRLYVKNALNGAAVAPRLGDPSISARSAALGDPISPGSRRYYQVYYRDPDLSFCPSPSGSTFNVSNGMRVTW